MNRTETWVQQYGSRMEPGPDGVPTLVYGDDKDARNLIVQMPIEVYLADYRHSEDGRIWRRVR